MAGTAFFRHSIPYEVFYAVHFLFLAVYAIAVGEYVVVVHDGSTFSPPSFYVSSLVYCNNTAHTIDVGQRSGKNNRSQTFKWFAAPLIYYLCDYAMMWFNQR